MVQARKKIMRIIEDAMSERIKRLAGAHYCAGLADEEIKDNILTMIIAGQMEQPAQ